MMPQIEVLSIGRHIYDEDYIHIPKSALHLHALFELELDRHVAHWFVEASAAFFLPSLAQREGPHILPDNTLIAVCFPYNISHSKI